MIPDRQAIWLFLILLMLAGSSWYFAKPKEKIHLDKRSLLTTADVLVHGLTLYQYDAKGQRANKLSTPIAQHFKLTGSYVLQDPQITLDSQWHIRAAEGKVTQDGKTITFSKGITLDANEPEKTTASADRASLDLRKHQGNYQGNVRVDQANTHIRGQYAFTQGNEKNKLVWAVLKDRAHYWTRTADNKPLLHAHADQIYYYPERHRIILTGHAKIKQGRDLFTGENIQIDTLHQQILSESSTPTQIIIHSEHHP